MRNWAAQVQAELRPTIKVHIYTILLRVFCNLSVYTFGTKLWSGEQALLLQSTVLYRLPPGHVL